MALPAWDQKNVTTQFENRPGYEIAVRTEKTTNSFLSSSREGHFPAKYGT
jgi:hypothetical protein